MYCGIAILDGAPSFSVDNFHMTASASSSTEEALPTAFQLLVLLSIKEINTSLNASQSRPI